MIRSLILRYRQHRACIAARVLSRTRVAAERDKVRATARLLRERTGQPVDARLA